MHDPLTAGVLFGDFVKFRKMKLRVGTQGCERGKTLPCETGKECLVAESAAYDAFLDFIKKKKKKKKNKGGKKV